MKIHLMTAALIVVLSTGLLTGLSILIPPTETSI